MAQREVLTLNQSIPRVEVPQAGDTYLFPVDINFEGDEVRIGDSTNSNTRFLYFIPSGGSTANASYISSGGALTLSTVNSLDDLKLNAGGDINLISRTGNTIVKALSATKGVIFKDSNDDTILSLDTSSINFYSTSTLQWTFDTTGVTASNVNGPKIRNITGTSTTPNLLPDKSDTDTGIWGAADTLNFACGGALTLELAEGLYGTTGTTLFIPDVTVAPSTNPGSGGLLYADAGALKWRSSNGTVTTVAIA